MKHYTLRMPLMLLLAIAGTSWPSTDAIGTSVRTSTELMKAYANQSITDILITQDLSLDGQEWNALPGAITLNRSVTVRGVVEWSLQLVDDVQRNVSTYTLLNGNHLFQRVHLAPGVWLTYQSLMTMNLISNSEGFYQELINGSPQSSVVYKDILVRRLVCPPYNNSVANVRRIARPSVEAARGLTNGSVNTVHYIDKPYCYASRSLVLAQCNQPYLVMQDGGGVVALTEGHVANGGQGGYNLYYLNQVYVCMKPVSYSCLALNSLQSCIGELERAMSHDGVNIFKVASAPLPSPSTGGGVSSGARVGAIVGGVLGGLLLLAGLVGGVWLRRRRLRQYAAGADKMPKAESGQGSGHTWDSPFTNAGVDLEPRGPNGPPAHGSMHGVRRARCSAISHNGTVPVLMQPTHPSGQASGHEHILAPIPIASAGKADEVQGERQLPMDGCHGSSAGAGSTGTSAAASKAEPFKHQVEALQRAMDNREGDRDELRVVRAIGRGAHGRVYYGTWRGQQVAIKAMLVQGDAADISARAALEVAVSTTLRHPNVVSTLHYDLVPVGGAMASASTGVSGSTRTGVGRQAGAMTGNRGTSIVDACNPAPAWKLYIVQEFAASGDLGQAISHGRLSFAKMTPCQSQPCLPDPWLRYNILRGIAEGMRYMHARGVIHGDLKPGNVLLKADPNKQPPELVPKLCDFGLAATLAADRTHVSNWRAGTPLYMAPETLSCGQVSQASDVYAYGVLLWELCSGRRCYEVRQQNGALSMHPAFGTFPPDTDTAYVALFVRCLNRNARERPSFDEILLLLSSIGQRLAASGHPPSSLPSCLPLGDAIGPWSSHAAQDVPMGMQHKAEGPVDGALAGQEQDLLGGSLPNWNLFTPTDEGSSSKPPVPPQQQQQQSYVPADDGAAVRGPAAPNRAGLAAAGALTGAGAPSDAGVAETEQQEGIAGGPGTCMSNSTFCQGVIALSPQSSQAMYTPRGASGPGASSSSSGMAALAFSGGGSLFTAGDEASEAQAGADSGVHLQEPYGLSPVGPLSHKLEQLAPAGVDLGASAAELVTEPAFLSIPELLSNSSWLESADPTTREVLLTKCVAELPALMARLTAQAQGYLLGDSIEANGEAVRSESAAGGPAPAQHIA